MKNLNEPVAVSAQTTSLLPGAAPGDTPLGTPEKAERRSVKSEYLDASNAPFHAASAGFGVQTIQKEMQL